MSGGVEPGVQQREQLACLVGRLQVVGLLRIAERDVVPVVRGEGGFQCHHPGRRILGIGHAGQAEHGAHVLPVGLHHRGELLLTVVGLVGEAEAALARVQQNAVGVSGVGGRVDVEQPRHIGAEQPAGQCQQFGNAGRGEHLGQASADGVHALGLDGCLIHEAAVEVADLPLDAAGLGTPWRRLPR